MFERKNIVPFILFIVQTPKTNSVTAIAYKRFENILTRNFYVAF